jgi:hypothetical protein
MNETIFKSHFRRFTCFVILGWMLCTLIHAEMISSDAVGFAEVSLNKSDPGISWMVNQWLKVPRSNSIKSFVQHFKTDKATAMVFTNPKTGELRFVVMEQALENMETPAAQKTISQIMLSEIKADKFKTSSYNGKTLYFGPRADGKYETGYFISGNSLVWGTDLNAVKKIADVATEGKNSISTLSDYQDLKNRIPSGSNAIMYMNNSQSLFANVLAKQEKKWKMSLLLSAKDISGIILGMNFVDGDKITGSAIFKAKNSAALPDIQDDAGFIGEAIRRKFVNTKITYKRQVSTNGNYVTLQFEMNGLKPLMKELFDEGVSSLLQ